MARGGVGWRLLDVVVGQPPPLILAPPFFGNYIPKSHFPLHGEIYMGKVIRFPGGETLSASESLESPAQQSEHTSGEISRAIRIRSC